MAGQPKRPSNVPDKAAWNEGEQEWELGELKGGKYSGFWKWWRKDGSIVCETNFDNSGNIIDYKRYHPDGTISRMGTYKNGVEHGLTKCFRSHKATNEFFPPRASDEIWRTESLFEKGYILKERYFLEDGMETNEKGVDLDDVEYDYDKDDYDKDGYDEDEHDVIEQSTFETPEQASKRWIEEGLSFAGDLNAWLAIGYEKNWEDVDMSTEPHDTRSDMASYVIDYLAKANQAGDYDSPRKLFPPAHAPIRHLLEEQGQFLPQLLLLESGEIVVRVGGYWQNSLVYKINDNKITKLDGVIAIGACPNKKYYAKAYEDKIEITHGFDGDVISTLPYPKNYGKALDGIDVLKSDFENQVRIMDLVVFPDGKKVLFISRTGIFAISAKGSELIFPHRELLEDRFVDYWKDEYEDAPDDEKDPFEIDMDMGHGAISADGKYIAVGCQDSSHYVLDENHEVIGTIYPRSEYPHFACFHDKKGYVIFNACHFYNGATVAAKLDLLPGLEADAYEADERLIYLDEVARVYAAVATEEGMILGDANGYLWHRKGHDSFIWYCFVGSTICAMDVSKDGKTLVVSTYAGIVHKLNLDGEKDPYRIAIGNIKEEKRWLFWKDYEPMVW